MAEIKETETDSKSSVLTALLSDKDPLIKLATLALVVLGGFGNFFATKSVGDTNQTELNLAIREIHDIHGVIDSSIKRQKEIHDMLEQILSPQRTADLDKATREVHEMHQQIIPAKP